MGWRGGVSVFWITDGWVAVEQKPQAHTCSVPALSPPSSMPLHKNAPIWTHVPDPILLFPTHPCRGLDGCLQLSEFVFSGAWQGFRLSETCPPIPTPIWTHVSSGDERGWGATTSVALFLNPEKLADRRQYGYT
uniref:Uncharacterized protein n=1 Tax=Mesocestoides corti TaxID=53468 RepID=A0A5K3F6X9_MESCO